MVGNRDGKSAKNKKLPGAAVVNDHMYPHPHLFHDSMTPFGSKKI